MKVDDTVQPRDRLAENLFERRSVRITEIDRIHMNRAADMQLLGDFMLDIVHHIMAGRNIDSGVDVTFGEKPGSELITSAFSTIFGTKASALFIAFALMMFAYSTILGWSLYGTRCVQYLFGMKAVRPYQIFFCIIIVVGCVSPIDAVWDIADTFNGLMAIPNFIALFALSPVVFKLTKEHFAEVDKRKARDHAA